MVRISDARMSGTAYGACVLHVAPESFVGGPLALVRDGDLVVLENVSHGIDHAAEAFCHLMSGGTMGKTLVELDRPEEGDRASA
jgi:dihydroxyacid dehydratase/phosphogluconate dehydratase